MWHNPLELAMRVGGMMPNLVNQLTQRLGSFELGQRQGLLDGIQDQIHSVAFRNEWQAGLMAFGLALLMAEFLAILLLHRLKTDT